MSSERRRAGDRTLRPSARRSLDRAGRGVVAPDPATWTLLRSETGRLSWLSEDVARVSRAEEGRLDLRPQRTRLETLPA